MQPKRKNTILHLISHCEEPFDRSIEVECHKREESLGKGGRVLQGVQLVRRGYHEATHTNVEKALFMLRRSKFGLSSVPIPSSSLTLGCQSTPWGWSGAGWPLQA